MQTVLTILFLTFLTQVFGQTTQLAKIESEIKKNATTGQFDKQIIDLNNDSKDDIIYIYQCGEPRCIKVFINIDGLYKEQISEQCISFSLWTVENKKILNLRLTPCCGESPYFSNRTFEFDQTSAILKDNYVLTNNEYTGQISILTPFSYSTNPFFVKVSLDNYNLRFSPSIEKLEGKAKEIFTYACEDGTNIIAKIKIASRIKVLSELIEKDRTWLFVEVEKSMISGGCNPITFDFKEQKLRGWISNKYVERE